MKARKREAQKADILQAADLYRLFHPDKIKSKEGAYI
jgi:hypothetical protein